MFKLALAAYAEVKGLASNYISKLPSRQGGDDSKIPKLGQN